MANSEPTQRDFKADLDLGDDHYLSWSVQAVYNDPPNENRAKEDENGKTIIDERGPIGATVRHRTPTGGWCEGGLTFDVPHLHEGLRVPGGRPAPLWKIESMDPLTLSPSLLCHCGDHGFARDGRWQRA